MILFKVTLVLCLSRRCQEVLFILLFVMLIRLFVGVLAVDLRMCGMIARLLASRV